MASQLSQTNSLLSLVGTQASPAFSSMLTPVSMTQPSVNADFSAMLKGMVTGTPLMGAASENGIQNAIVGEQPAVLVGMSLPLEGQMLPELAIDAAMSKQILNMQDELGNRFADTQLQPEVVVSQPLDLPQVPHLLDQTLPESALQPVLAENVVASEQPENINPTLSQTLPVDDLNVTTAPDNVLENQQNTALDSPSTLSSVVGAQTVPDPVKAEVVTPQINNPESEPVVSMMPEPKEKIVTAKELADVAPVQTKEFDVGLQKVEKLTTEQVIDKAQTGQMSNDHLRAETAVNQAVVQQSTVTQSVYVPSQVAEASERVSQPALVAADQAQVRPDVVVPTRAPEKGEMLIGGKEKSGAPEVAIPSRVQAEAASLVAPEAKKSVDAELASLQRTSDKSDKVVQVNLANGTPVNTEAAPEKADVKLARILESVSRQVAPADGESEKSMLADTSAENAKSTRADANNIGSIHQPSMARPTATVQLQMPPGMMPSHPQWGQAVSERVMWSANQKVQTASIQLDPPELGSLQVKLNISHDQVSVSFTSPHAHVRDALEQSLPRLREMMAEQWLNLGESSVNDQSSSQDQSKRERFAGDGRGLIEENGVVHQETLQMSKLSLVDYYA